MNRLEYQGIMVNCSIKMALNAAKGIPFNRGSESNRMAEIPRNPGDLKV